MAIGATTVWRVRPSGNNANGGGYDPAISGAGTDYSQQNTAQLSLTDLAAAGSTAVVTSATGGFTSAMVGNGIKLASGTNIAAGLYFIVGYTNTNTVTLDRNPGTVAATACSGGVCKVGGAWADPFTNPSSGIGGGVNAGNIVYLKASGVPNPSSYTYDYSRSGGFQGNNADTTNGPIQFLSDPTNGVGEYPTVRVTSNNSLWYGTDRYVVRGIWFVAGTDVGQALGGSNQSLDGNVFDSFGYDVNWVNLNKGQVTRNEFTTTVNTRSGSSNAVVTSGSTQSAILNNNFHGVSGVALALSGYAGTVVQFNVFAKCQKAAIENSFTADGALVIQFNSFYNNLGHGIDMQSSAAWAGTHLSNNIFSTHTGSGKKAINATGTLANNNRLKTFLDYNVFYNNTTDYNTSSITGGANDTTGGADPFTNAASKDYTLTSTYFGVGVFPGAALPQLVTGSYG